MSDSLKSCAAFIKPMIEGVDYFVRVIHFPYRAIRAMVVPNDDGTYDIYIDDRLTAEQRAAALAHELRHLAGGHFYSLRDIRSLEREADDRRIDPKKMTPPKPPKQRIRCVRCHRRAPGKLSPAGLCAECVADDEIERRRADLRQVEECEAKILELQPVVERALKHVPFYLKESREEDLGRRKACQDALSGLAVLRKHPRFYEAVGELASLHNHEILCHRFSGLIFTRDIDSAMDLLEQRLKYEEKRNIPYKE